MKQLIFCLILTLPVFTQADPLSQTKDFLHSPTQREKYMKIDPKAKDMDDKVSALARDSANKEEIYDLASQVLDRIAAEANGDPKKMQELLLKAQKDPEGFYKQYMSDSQKAQIHNLATKIDQTGRTPSSP